MCKKYGIVLVGCGYMGAAHMEGIYYRSNVEIRGVVDLDPERADAFRRRYGALSSSTDYRTYLKDPGTDIVIIATYPSTHLEILKDCTAHGKHVLCEKPITSNYKEAQEFISIVKNTSAKVLVGHVLRHNTTYCKVAELIQSGAIGAPIVIRIVQNKHTSRDWDRYFSLMKEVSPLVDCGVHYIDIMQWFTRSKITGVSGIGTATEADIPNGSYNYCMLTFKLDDGSIAFYESGWGNTIASEDLKEFVGPKGRIRIIYQKDRQTHREEGDMIEYYRYPENQYHLINSQAERKPTWEQLKYLIRMIEENIPADPGIDEVYSAFEIVLAADRMISDSLMR